MSSNVEIISDNTTLVKRFGVQGRKVDFKIKSTPSDTDPATWIKSAIEEVIRLAFKELRDDDKVGITFHGAKFTELGPGWMSYRNASQVKMEDVWEIISKIFQSNSEGMSTDTFSMGVTSVRLPKGKGNPRGQFYNNYVQECKARSGIVFIENDDNLCLPRALVVAIAKTKGQAVYDKIRRSNSKYQENEAMRLLQRASVKIPTSGASIAELEKLQKFLTGYKITVYAYGYKGRSVFFEGATEGINLNLLHHKKHFSTITSTTSAFACDYFCERCHVPYNTKNAHRCGGSCPCCRQSPACPKAVNIHCEACNRDFRGPDCFASHQQAGVYDKESICNAITRCTECLKTTPSNRKHTCGEVFCKTCYKHQPQGHKCFIRKDTKTPTINKTLFVFYDLETRQEKILDEKTNQHEVNLCVFSKRCYTCIDNECITSCKTCGARTEFLSGDNVVFDFIGRLLTLRKKFKSVIVIAHNGQAFDHQFILQQLFHQTDHTPDLIMRGTKIIKMTMENLTFIDSLNYFPMALSNLPKAFELPSTFKKGYFPHLFNTKANENYCGTLPGMEFYSPDTMKVTERITFMKWYEAHKNDKFDMQYEIRSYCESDVRILTEACLKFRKMLIDTCNVCPFTEACTIASACNLVFRRNFIKPNTIGIIPKCGYREADKQSKLALQWLIGEEERRGIDIQHAGKGREAVVSGVKVDGYHESDRLVFEFHGCYYHGHELCMRSNRDNELHDDPNDTLNLRAERTKAKTNRLRSHGYTVVEMWECEFRKSTEFKQFIDHPLLTSVPLNARDAFYGGRTGNTYTYYKCKDGEKIKYIDVCSLYPFVCKNGKFPLGHPKVHVGDQVCRDLVLKVDGLVKCKILPPPRLYHPVLPMKQNNRLMFSLCRMCSQELNTGDCEHNDEERAITGTWVIDEVRMAIQKGYELLEVYEIWSYEVQQYDRSTSKDGLFTDMMNKFIKKKQQASGWPTTCTTEEEKERYIKEFLENETILLEYIEIGKNPGLRSLAKMILNSFWGKFGQRENQTKTSIVVDPSKLFELVNNPAVEVSHIMAVNDKVIVVNWAYIEEAADVLGTVNVSIAAFTTAQARLKLYSYLDQLGDRVLYYDTDSVIYISREGEYDPPTGEFVGDMTDELTEYGPGSYITEFVSGGPKNYGYKVFSTNENAEKAVCKVKGLCLNYETSQIVNFKKIKAMVLTPGDFEPLLITSRNIRRTEDHTVVTNTEVKSYKPRSEKRKFLPDLSSEPYGYKNIKLLSES